MPGGLRGSGQTVPETGPNVSAGDSAALVVGPAHARVQPVACQHPPEERKAVFAGGVSPLEAGAAFRRAEADYGAGWYASICADIWGAA